MIEFRGALIGCGFFAVNHLHGWKDAKDASVVAICDQDPQRLKAVGDQFGIAARYTDARDMLERERPDFVDIATTVPSHRVLVELAAEWKVPVICQKPFASSLSDAQAMIEACSKAGIPLMIHENFRFQSPVAAVKRALISGSIGKPFWGRVSFRSAYDVFTGQPYLAKGERFIAEDLGIHALDISRFLLGDVCSVSARIARVNPNIRGEDVATIMLDHDEGVTSIIDCSYATKLETELFPQTLIEIDGSDGTLRLGPNYQLTATNKSATTHHDVSPLLLPWASKPWHNIQESVALIQQHWVDCLKDGREPETSGRDNLKTLALVEAVYESARTGQTVTP
jgi:D-apiose dehydrogenase